MTEHHLMTRPSDTPVGGYPATYAPVGGAPAAHAGMAQGGWPPPPASPPPQSPRVPVPPGRPPRGRRTAWLIAAVAAGLVMMLVIATGAFLAGRIVQQSRQTDGYPGVSDQAPAAPPAAGYQGVTSAQIAGVAAKVAPGIVNINTVLGYQQGAAAGTGIVLSADGLVLTNNHVVAGATSIRATDVGNGRTYQASVVGYDRSADIAVVKLSAAAGLAVAPLGDSSAVSAGDGVVAIGNAGGTGTPTAVGGTVTALGQSITAQDQSTGASEQLTGLIEVAAAIQPGDSGGPLATTSGKVVGVNTAASAGFRYQAAGGDGYAIPIDQAVTIAKQIKTGKGSDTVHIGATAFLGIQTGAQRAGGALVLGVVSGSPAETAGLSRGDVIQSLNGQDVDSPTALTGLLDRYHPGDRISIGWIDTTGQAHTATVVAAAGPVG